MYRHLCVAATRNVASTQQTTSQERAVTKRNKETRQLQYGT